PRQLGRGFDQQITVIPGGIKVLVPAGRNVAGLAHVTRDKHGVAASIPPLPKGPYTIRWTALSNDGHVVSGVYTFGVRVVAPPPTEAVGAQGPTRTEHVVRWAYFLALALLWPAFVLGLGFASGLSLSGHSAVDAGSSWVSELADWIHLSAASLWVGGLIQLVAVVWPAAPELRRTAFLRFSRFATVLVGLLLAAGVYLSVVRLPRLADLWSTGYGRVLLVKLGLVSVALLWG